MPDELFDQLGFGDGGTATMGRSPSNTYRVLAPGAGANSRARARVPQGGNRIEPLTSAKYPMKSGPAPSNRASMPAAPAPAPQLGPKYDPGSYDPVAEYARLRGRMGLPAEAPPAPMPVHQHAPSTGTADTFLPGAQQQARTVVAARAAQGAGRMPGLTGRMAQVGQYGLEGGFLPKAGTPGQQAAALGVTAMAGAVNNPQAALHMATNPVSSGAGLAQSGYNALVNPQQSWGPDFTTGMTRLLQGQVSPGEMAGAVGDATGVRPVFNAGVRMGNTLNLGLTDPAELARRFGRGMGAIGNAVMGY